MEKLVISHRHCHDGFCAAWLFNKVMPEAEHYFAQHGEDPPNVKDKSVYIADFSYKRDIMQDIIREAASVVVLDHHKTAAEELKDLYLTAAILQKRVEVWFDMDKSGAHIAWDWLWREYPTEMNKHFSWPGKDGLHWLVAYTEDHDLRKHKLENSHAIQAALKLAKFEFDWWDKVCMWDKADLIETGEHILQYQRVLIDQHKKNARIMTIAGHKVPVVNSTVLFSDIAGELSEGYPFAACYFDTLDGKRVFSLRSREGGIDVSEIAKIYGGGGHRNAASFHMLMGHLKEI